MKIILLTDVKKLGVRGDIKDVADGYAQNVLIPKKLALPATAAALKQAEEARGRAEEKLVMSAALAKKTLAELDGKTVHIEAKASESGTLFEAIREKQIIEAIGKHLGVHLPDTAVDLAEPIKKKGTYAVPVGLHGAKAEISVII